MKILVMDDIASIMACYRELAQELNQSITQNRLDAALPAMLKKSIEMEKEFDIDFVLQDAHELIGDNGRGIPSEHLSLIFNPFFTTKEIGRGVGLGLTTAFNIVKMHNGSIHCQSEPGKETAFTVRLPGSSGTV
jgi:C4-dicarboxylate-specific signal transduction histidine kinase